MGLIYPTGGKFVLSLDKTMTLAVFKYCGMEHFANHLLIY